MKKMLALTLLVLVFSCVHTFSILAAVPGDIRVGNPGYGGNGCPGGSASVTISPDSKSLSILFDEYVANAGGATNRSFDRKACNLAIPVHIPQGYSISIFKVDYRGFVNVPFGGDGRFNVEYFFAGIRGPVASKVFPGGYSDEYVLSNNVVGESVVWSPCGQDVNLRVNTSMMVRTNRSFEDAMGSVDSVDLNAGIVYHIQWRTCTR